MFLFISIFAETSRVWSTCSTSPAGTRALEDAPRPVGWYQRSALCVAMYYDYFFFFFFLKRRWIIQTSTSGRKAPFLPERWKAIQKKIPPVSACAATTSFSFQKCIGFVLFSFLQEAAETVAGPSLWVAASPCWLIPLINRFTETYSRRSTRLRPELIVGVKERVSKFWCQQLKMLEMLPSERLNNISSLNLPTSVQSIPLLYSTESSLFLHFSVTEVASLPSVWGPSHHADDFQ